MGGEYSRDEPLDLVVVRVGVGDHERLSADVLYRAGKKDAVLSFLAQSRLASNPNNQPFFMGAFILVFLFADGIWEAAFDVAAAYLELVAG